jgi:hypothetical protein
MQLMDTSALVRAKASILCLQLTHVKAYTPTCSLDADACRPGTATGAAGQRQSFVVQHDDWRARAGGSNRQAPQAGGRQADDGQGTPDHLPDKSAGRSQRPRLNIQGRTTGIAR